MEHISQYYIVQFYFKHIQNSLHIVIYNNIKKKKN